MIGTLLALQIILEVQVAPDLDSVLKVSHPDEIIPLYVVMKDQYNPQTLYEKLNGKDRGEKLLLGVKELKEFSRRTQKELLKKLKELGAEDIKSLWLVNVVAFKLKASKVQHLREIQGIESLELDEKRKLILDVIKGEEAPKDNTNQGGEIQEIVWGVQKINAHLVWSLGYTGAGVIVGIIDTGVNYNHVDISSRIWVNPGEIPGNNLDDDGNGFIDDLLGWDFVNDDNNPMDDNGHGTHVAGTVAGDGTAGSQTGVAPGARIMCLKVLDSQGYGTESDVWSSIQYAVEKGAQVLNLSLGWPFNANPQRKIWRDILTNASILGVVSAVAAGNEGNLLSSYPVPNNIRTPGNVPPPWRHPDQPETGTLSGVITCGATDASDVRASFSSIGPVTWQNVTGYNDYPYNPGRGLIKPDVTAPGVNIKSLAYNNNTGYISNWSGTSMATPHLAGTIALILSKNPGLTPRQIDSIIELSSVPLGPTGKDTLYGAGRINAYNAILWTPILGNDVKVQKIISPDSIVNSHIPITPTVLVRNIGNFLATFPVIARIDSSGIRVYTDTAWASNLQPGDSLIIQFSPWTPRRGNYKFTVFTNLLNDGNRLNDTLIRFVRAYPMGNQYLVLDLDPNRTSGPGIDSILRNLGYRGRYMTSPPPWDTLVNFQSLFICLGIYPNNYRIPANSTLANMIINFLNSGKRVYMEGGDVWYYDPTAGGHNFNNYFGISAISDGSGDLGRVRGVSGSFAQGMVFRQYNGENQYIDRIQRNSSIPTSMNLLENISPSYRCGVINNHSVYKTCGLSFELMGLQDSTFPGTKAELLSRIMQFFGINVLPEDTVFYDVGVISINTPTSTVPVSSWITPCVTVKNFEDSTVTFKVFFEITHSGFLFYKDSVSLVLSYNDTSRVYFRPILLDSAGYFLAKSYTSLLNDQNRTNDTLNLNFWVYFQDRGQYLVWDLDPNHTSGPFVHQTLRELGYPGIYTQDISYRDSLPQFSSVWVFAGIYPNKYVFTDGSPESQKIVEYLSTNGNLYIEGGDIWFYDPVFNNGFDFGSFMGIQGVSDGLNDLSGAVGMPNTFTENLNFQSYTGENQYIDRIQPINGGFAILKNPSPNYIIGIAYESSYKSVGLSFEIAHLQDGTYPNLRKELIKRIMEFFHGTANPPEISVNPTYFQITTDFNTTVDTIFKITNFGSGPLVFSITSNTAFNFRENKKINDPRTQKNPVEKTPKDIDKGVYQEPQLNSWGGPDLFGYIWMDSREVNGPSFSWIEISTTGTPIYLGDDDFQIVSLPWQFPFYGGLYSSLRVSSNGYVTFGNVATEYLNQPIPTTQEPNNLIAVFWDDLNPSLRGRVYYRYVSQLDVFVITWKNVPRYNEPTSSLTFQLILYPNGTIKFQYLQLLGTTNSSTVGIENSTGTSGLQVAFNQNYLTDSLAVVFIPPGSPPQPWFNFTPQNGVIPPGELMDIQVNINTSLLRDTFYRIYLNINSNDPDEREVVVTFDINLILRGDVNDDGVINHEDIIYLSNYLYYEGNPPKDPQKADVNVDGEIDDLDLINLTRKVYSP